MHAGYITVVDVYSVCLHSSCLRCHCCRVQVAHHLLHHQRRVILSRQRTGRDLYHWLALHGVSLECVNFSLLFSFPQSFSGGKNGMRRNTITSAPASATIGPSFFNSHPVKAFGSTGEISSHSTTLPPPGRRRYSTTLSPVSFYSPYSVDCYQTCQFLKQWSILIVLDLVTH